MANWFKIHETDLDETRMRYAMSKLPAVWPVWTALLMECCKHKSDTFPWGSDEQELFGFSDRLKISIPVVSQAVGILEETGYIKIEGNSLKVLRWNEKQNDYLIRKKRGDYDNRGESPIIADTIGKAQVKERRGEEIKEIKESTTPPVPPKVALPPTSPVNPTDFERVRDELCSLYGKKPGTMEINDQDALQGVMRRDGVLEEWEKIKSLRVRKGPQYFPHTIAKLLGDWDGAVQKANIPDAPKINPTTGKPVNPNWYADAELKSMERKIKSADEFERLDKLFRLREDDPEAYKKKMKEDEEAFEKSLGGFNKLKNNGNA